MVFEGCLDDSDYVAMLLARGRAGEIAAGRWLSSHVLKGRGQLCLGKIWQSVIYVLAKVLRRSSKSEVAVRWRRVDPSGQSPTSLVAAVRYEG